MLLTSDTYLQDFNKVLEEKGLEKITKVSLNRNQVKALVLEGTPMIINGMNEGTQILFRLSYGKGDILNLWYSKLTHIVEYVNSDFGSAQGENELASLPPKFNNCNKRQA